jgi:hypothetical protein
MKILKKWQDTLTKKHKHKHKDTGDFYVFHRSIAQDRVVTAKLKTAEDGDLVVCLARRCSSSMGSWLEIKNTYHGYVLVLCRVGVANNGRRTLSIQNSDLYRDPVGRESVRQCLLPEEELVFEILKEA